MTFDLIQKANESIKTTEIKGKDYAEVNQRIKAFRMVYPQGFITTELISDTDGVCKFRASVGYYDKDGEPFTIGTGTAYEKENSTFINKTSYIENCETSAVGRALGMAGFGIDTSVASYEEVQTAIANQSTRKKDEEYKEVKCSKCGKVILKQELKGKIRTPQEIVDKLGCCVECYRKEEFMNKVAEYEG